MMRGNLREWKKWRIRHYHDGTMRPDDALGWMLTNLLSTTSGARALRRADRRYGDFYRPQHTPPVIKDADYLHRAYGRKRGKCS